MYDAVTFRWAIFLVVIAELISLISLIGYLCYELCVPPKPDYQRMDSARDEVADLPTATYGSTQANNGGIPVAGPRIRKYSESVGRSYVASAVARYLHMNFSLWLIPDNVIF